MINYEPFWHTLQEKNISTYTLIQHHKISSSTISRLRNNKGISTTTLNDLCNILCCNVEDVIKFIPDHKK